MKKEAYEPTELIIHVFASTDMIITSDDFDPDPNEGNPVSG